MGTTGIGNITRPAIKRIRELAACNFLLLIGLMLILRTSAYAEEPGKVAVLPFRIHAPEPLDHLKKNLQVMLNINLANKDLSMINPTTVNKHPSAFSAVLPVEDVISLGQDLGAAWVVTGDLTQIGKSISLDLKVFDVTTKEPPFSIFITEDDIDRVNKAIQRASVSINNQIAGVVQIDSIQVQGNKRVESEAILSVMDSKKGDGIDYDKLDSDLRAIYKLGYFRDVSIETEKGPKGIVITFVVKEKESITSISFQGNKKVKSKDLMEEAGIKLYSILNPSEITQSINRLEEFYRLKGYYNVEIKDKLTELPNNEVSLVYEVVEGEKVYIRKIEFVGNEHFDDGDLKGLLQTKKRGLLSIFLKTGLLNKEKLEFDRHKLISFYHNQGYLKAKVGQPKVSYKEGEGLTITFEIIEGEPYEVNEVKITGDLIIPAEILLEKVDLKDEKYFSREIVRKDTLTLREIYADVGFAYADVTPLTSEDDKNHLVDIIYRISKRQKVRFERINISGNERTRDKVIRRELDTIEGEFFSGEALRRSTQNLHRLGFFGNVEVQTKKGSQDDLILLDINVEEQATGSLSMGIGYSSFDKTAGTFSLSESNLFGRGQKAAATVSIGSRTADFNLRFTEPWFLDRRLSVTGDLYRFRREFDEYTKDSFGGALRVGFPLRRLDRFTTLTLGYRYDDADIFDVGPNAAPEIQEMVGNNITSSANFLISRDSRDKLWDTSRGSINSFRFEYAGEPLGGTVAYNRYEPRTAWFFPLPLETVFLVQGRWGYLVERSDDGILPSFQKYRIGGINTVRGFEAFSIAPRDPDTGDVIGGEKMMNYNLEFRFPLLTSQGVTGLVFFDAGNVWTKDQNIDFGDLRTSAGGGIRWYSPVGPLRLEYGFNLDPRPGEDSGKFEFAIGGSF
jgi:outer membrane protein insertion porin family